MSNFKDHAHGGMIMATVTLTVSVISYPNHHLGIWYIATLPLMTFIFSLFPDVDVKSKTSNYFYIAVLLSIASCYATQRHELGNVIAMISLIPQLVKHRGLLHSSLFGFTFPLTIFYAVYMGKVDINYAIGLYLASIIGYQTHLIMDYFSGNSWGME
jgi:hypothetical protein